MLYEETWTGPPRISEMRRRGEVQPCQERSGSRCTDDVDGMNYEPTCGGLNCLLRLQANTERQTELQQQAKSSQQALKGATAF